MILLLFLTLLIGLMGGAVGVGGMLQAPVFEIVARLDPHTAIGTAMCSLIPSIIAGAYMYRSVTRKEWRTALPVILGGVLMVGPGVMLKAILPGAILTLILGCFIFLSGMPAFFLKASEEGPSALMRKKSVLFALGAVIGVLAGLTGMGGSALCVPSLMLMGYAPLVGIATGFTYSVPVSILGSLGNYANQAVDLPLAGITAGVGALGTCAGALLARRVPQRQLKRCVSVGCMVAGLCLVIRSL